MTGRIEKAFAKAKAEGRGAFVAYLTAGYPSMDAFEGAADDLVAGGADILEIGVPFSDPFADGAVIRQAAYAALRNGTDLDSSIAAAARIRARHPETGIVLFSYCNPLLVVITPLRFALFARNTLPRSSSAFPACARCSCICFSCS